MTFDELILAAKSVLGARKITDRGSHAMAGSVAAALLSESGNVYLGVCIEVCSGIGFCAEHAAIGTMVTAGESKIVKAVAIHEAAGIIPPCGRCREFMSQIHKDNIDTEIIIATDKTVTLRELLPYRWDEAKDEA